MAMNNTYTAKDFDITEGTILTCTIGYSMTIPMFFQVVNISPSGKTIKVRRIKNQVVDGGGYTGYIMPVKDEWYFNNDDIETLRIVDTGNPRVPARHNKRYPLYVWDGEAQYYDHWD